MREGPGTIPFINGKGEKDEMILKDIKEIINEKKHKSPDEISLFLNSIIFLSKK